MVSMLVPPLGLELNVTRPGCGSGTLGRGLSRSIVDCDSGPALASADDAAVQLDVTSVITQVQCAVPEAAEKWSTCTAVPPPPPAGVATAAALANRASSGPPGWRHRVRHLFCCLAPPRPGPAGAAFAGKQQPLTLLSGFFPNAGSALPPPLPAHWREAVIGPKVPQDAGKKTLVLDLDETLVHSSFKPIPNPDYILPVEIDGRLVDVYVLKRPWLDHFLATVGPRFEVVVFTASLAKYADPLLDLMDTAGLVRWRLFREACCCYQGNYVKDLSCLGRELADTIIVDNSPHSYVFQPANAVPIETFIDDMEDQALLELLPQLLQVCDVDDVRQHLGPNLLAAAAHAPVGSCYGGNDAGAGMRDQ